MRFKDQVVMISGAASGFGRLAAERFAEEGARLSLSDLDAGGLAETAAGIGGEVMTVTVDVSREEDQKRHVDETLARFGRIDVALNNAGVLHALKPIAELPVEDFDRMMAVNARGVFLGMKHQLPVMAGQGGGAIVNTASVAGLVGAQRLSAYVASKHAVVGLTRTAADEYGRFGIRVNAVCPAFAKTQMLSDMVDPMAAAIGTSVEDTHRRLSGRVPMGRVGEAEEIVRVMLMLADPGNTFMTGQAVAVDGGLSAI